MVKLDCARNIDEYNEKVWNIEAATTKIFADLFLKQKANIFCTSFLESIIWILVILILLYSNEKSREIVQTRIKKQSYEFFKVE
jgi:hypothetical protein